MSDPVTSRFLRFGVFELDLGARELRRNGLKVKLQDRPFEILSILLETPGEVVSREEFRRRIWPADTFVDFDHSLNVSIKKLRDALGDVADNPRFIATAGSRGYRFIAPVGRATAGAGEQRASEGLPEDRTPSDNVVSGATGSARDDHATRPSVIPHQVAINTPPAPVTLTPFPQKNRRLLGGLSLAVAVVLTFLVVQRLRSKPALNETDLILVTEFVNTTGEPVFDGAMKQALSVKLSESPFFNLAPDFRVRQTLGLMGRPPEERVVLPVARDICQRLGAKAAVAGSIMGLGSRYVLDLDAVNCLSGASLAHEQVTAQNKDEVLPALGQAIGSLRGKLGESLSSIQKFNTPIEQATTSSLAALKAYAEGDEKRAQGQELESIAAYKLAVELDPNFAIAYVRLGAVYARLQEPALADEYLRKGFERREHVSEREKLYIAAHYYADSTGDVPSAIQTYELWRQVYPRDWIPANNLGSTYTLVGRLDEAIEASQAALRLNPDHILPYYGLARAFIRSGRFAEGKAVCEKTIADKRDTTDIHGLLFVVGFAERDQAAMQRQADWAKGKPREGFMLMWQAWAATSLGQIHKAREIFQRAREAVLAEKMNEFASSITLDEAEFQVNLGNVSEARAALALAYRLAPIPQRGQADAAIVMARLGDHARTVEISEKLSKQFPLDTFINYVKLPEVRAAIAMDRKDPARAIEALKVAVPYDLGSPPDLMTFYYRGLAYLQQQSAKQAAAEFKKILDHQGIAATSPAIPLAQLGLARANALLGDAPASRREYEKLFALWNNADPDLAVLKDARREYARLKAP